MVECLEGTSDTATTGMKCTIKRYDEMTVRVGRLDTSALGVHKSMIEIERSPKQHRHVNF